MNSKNGREEHLEEIPLDLIIEILTRLPTKSIARFRCVSKLWESTLRSPIFTESFFAISSSRPKLLFTCRLNGKTFFFSSPQPQNSPSPLTASMSFSVNHPFITRRPVCGLVCGFKKYWNLEERRTDIVPFVCNPSTGQSFTLPKVETSPYYKTARPYLGYDPIDKQFKVLCMPWRYSEKYQVLTLGTGKELSWRMIKYDLPHAPIAAMGDLCINGVLYYSASVGDAGRFWDIVCYDIRYEKFSCIQKPRGMPRNSPLVNYKGKLAMLQPNNVNRICKGIKLWVLEDAEKHEWSCFIYVLPPPWKNRYEEKKLRFVGTTSRGEIVFSPNHRSDSFYLLYYNPERNSIARVEIQGMEAFKPHKAHIFLDHVEDLKLMASV